MQPDELSLAVKNVVDVLNKSDVLSAVRLYRASNSDDIAVASARLGHAGAVLVDGMESFSENEQQVARCLHLDTMSSPGYWQALTETSADPKEKAASIVQLYSRVMFASNHLPNLMKLLGSSVAQPAQVSTYVAAPLAITDGGLSIRLVDAGERAADPDRIARSIDGIDMLYSATASIARKPAMDLTLVRIDGGEHRDLHFAGEKDSITALWAVIDSIPAVLNELDPSADIDLSQVVNSLPIFQDLDTLAKLGTFNESDLNDIRETMHQGALLAIESGVILVSGDNTPAKPAIAATASAIDAQVVASSPAVDSPTAGSPTEKDEHYENYLREREAMQKQDQNGGFGSVDQKADDEQRKRDAVEDLLKNLGSARGEAK